MIFLAPQDAIASSSSAHLNSWQKSAFRQYQNDEYAKAKKILEKHRQDRFAKILLTFVYHQEWVYSQSKMQRDIWKGEYKALEASLGIKDIAYLTLVGQEIDKPKASKLAKKLLKKSFKNVHKTADVPLLLEFLGVPDPDINGYAINALNKILKVRRKIVKGGGTLRSKDIRMMNDRRLLGQLGAIVAQETVWGKKPNYPKGTKKAIQSLVLIEEPSLKLLDEVPSGVSVIKAKQKVQKAMNSRRKKFPKSNWYSATGKKRS